MNNPSPGRRPPLAAALLAAVAVCAGCASQPVPEAQLAVGRTAVNDALAAGAVDAAPLELRNAREKMARADAAVAAGRQDEARRLAEEAEVDGRLASAKARTARANLAVAEIRESIAALRDSLENRGAAGRPGTEVSP